MAFGAVLGKGKLGKASIISYHFAAPLLSHLSRTSYRLPGVHPSMELCVNTYLY
jgi:hypothetical protein